LAWVSDGVTHVGGGVCAATATYIGLPLMALSYLGMRIESVGIAVSAVPRQARCLP